MPEELLVRDDIGDSTAGEKYEASPSPGGLKPWGSCCVLRVREIPENPMELLEAGPRPLSAVVDRERRLVLDPLRLME